jgi:predicted nuclease of restriction endonuclease-like (RecB) superfamily
VKENAFLKTSGIAVLLTQIRDILVSARSTAYRTANVAMVQAYWNIGKVIVEEEQRGVHRADYGKAIMSELSKRLVAEFGRGFEDRNLFYMREFYLAFPILHSVNAKSGTLQKNGRAILHAVSAKSGIVNAAWGQSGFILNPSLNPELTWTHYRLLLKVDNPAAREFYIKEIIENNWSTRTLDRQIGTLYFERILSSRDKKPVRKEAMTKAEAFTPRDIIKDPYFLEFLELKENKQYLESDLEQVIIDKLEDFLLELGKGFAFVARQKRFTADGDHFYADLVFYNYRLRCFFLIDLKIGKLTHQDIGQMDMYVRWFEENEKSSGDNPTVGLILCSEKKEAIAHYSILQESKQIFASEYRMYLPSEKQLRDELKRERMMIEQQTTGAEHADLSKSRGEEKEE